MEGRHLAGGYLAIWKKYNFWIVMLAGSMQLHRWTICNLMKDMPLVERCTAREVMQVEGKYAAKEEVYVYCKWVPLLNDQRPDGNKILQRRKEDQRIWEN